MLHRLSRLRRAPVVGGLLAAAVAFALIPAGLGRLLPSAPATVVEDRVAGAAQVAGSAPDDGSGDGSAVANLLADGGGAGAAVGAPPASAFARVGDRPTPADPATLAGYRWPLGRGRLTLPFKPIPGGTFIRDGQRFHDGIDIASFCGDRVVAAHDGVVVAAGRHFDDRIGWLGDLSPYYARLDRKDLWKALPIALIVDDGNGYRSVYAHFERVVVHVGQQVRAGQLVGYEGRTGHASGCHVHYGLFSPLETARFGVRADIAKRLRTPRYEIARVDPLLVMPNGPEALRTRHFGVVRAALVPPPVVFRAAIDQLDRR